MPYQPLIRWHFHTAFLYLISCLIIIHHVSPYWIFEGVEGNIENSCELTIEGHESYCPNNPDDPACTEFLHNATNKKPAEICNSPGCFKDQDAEKYCLNYNDPTFCKTVGNICDAGGFVKPEDAYCKGVTD